MRTRIAAICSGFVLLCSTICIGDDKFASADYRITAEKFGLPKANKRTSEPFVVRIYKTDEQGEILPSKDQPEGYPFTIDQDYLLKANEKPRVHEGVDLQSRPSPNDAPKPLEFKAGVYGVVIAAGIGKENLIAVQVWDGSVLEFLHSSKSLVKKNDIVAPDTRLGITGSKGANAIHLHVQAKNSSHKPISPDLVFRVGQHKLESSVDPVEDWAAFDSEESNAFELKVENGVVHPHPLPPTKRIVEVIGGGGNVDLNLGEFWSYSEALACSLAWSKANPNDLRLTREREVSVKGK